MMQYIAKRLPENDRKRKWVAVSITVLIAALFTLWGIYGFGQYGIALFVLTPLFMGAGSTLIYGLKKAPSTIDALQVGLLTLVVFLASLLLFAIEGLICVVMAAPFGFGLTVVGAFIGKAILASGRNKAPSALLVLMGIIPTTAFVEKDIQPTLTSVVTTIEVSADIQTVWENVVSFPQLEAPTEIIFKAGIAYPIHAKMEGSGVGAVRYCHFTTGSFVEPITVWEPPHLLRFDVLEQPAPMRELSFWDIDAPHLHDYFISKQGQFKLTPLPNGNTQLEGTTWYYHDIKPTWYWQLWSNYIIHTIHERVLGHIQKNAEKKYQERS